MIDDERAFLDELKRDIDSPPPTKRICKADLRETELKIRKENDLFIESKSKHLNDLESSKLGLSEEDGLLKNDKDSENIAKMIENLVEDMESEDLLKETIDDEANPAIANEDKDKHKSIKQFHNIYQ